MQTRNPNTHTNQTPGTINLPFRRAETGGISNPDPKPNEQVPPVEVPGREENPEHIPEKGARQRDDFPVLTRDSD